MKVLVIGAGSMVEAILLGLKEKRSLSDWGIWSPSGTSASTLAQRVGAGHVVKLSEVNPEWVVLGCKPQQLPELSRNLNGLFQDCLFLSLLAAIEEGAQLNVLKARRLIRVMPNLSVRFREGVTLLSSNSAPEGLTEVSELFSELGMAKVLREGELEELTLLTGSGPALFYEFTKDLSRSFSSLPEEEREAMARQVLLGAGVSAASETLPLARMIDAVTSKGGVTIAVLEEWRKRNFKDLLKAGVEAGKRRTAELKELILRS